MKTTNKPTSNNVIKYIQLKFFDFMDGKHIFDDILNKRLNQESYFSNDYSLELDENNTFKYINPECLRVCPKIIKKGTITKNKQSILGNLLNLKNNNIHVKVVIKSLELRIKHYLIIINTF